MKKIQIFLASSIREFEREREQLELFLRNVSDQFEAKYQIQIRPVRCENLDPAYTVERKQEEYNQIIRDCELVFFIFFTKLGEYTYEEFRVAREQFEKCGRPQIYTYFKNLPPEQTMEQSLASFMDYLDKSLGHYYNTFDHLDTVKLRMLLSIRLQEMVFVEVGAENGQFCVDGVPVLPLNDVPEFRNNDPLQKLLVEYGSQEARYQRAKASYAARQDDPKICREYAQLSASRETLSREIRKLQEQILGITLNICSGQLQGNITPRQKEAYRLFEQGDLTGCMRILDQEDIDREFGSAQAVLEQLARANAEKYIREHMTAIDILSTMIHNPHRYREILERYHKIIPVAKKYLVEKDVFFKYCDFLMDLGRCMEARAFLQELISFCGSGTGAFSPTELARIYLACGDVHTKMTIHSHAARAYRKALKQLQIEPVDLSAAAAVSEKITGSVLAIQRSYRRNYVKEHGQLAYRFHLFTQVYRWIRKRDIRRLDRLSVQLLEQMPSDSHRLLRARVHFHYARFYEYHNNRLCQEHYLRALALTEGCEGAEAFVEQCLQAIVIFFWLVKPSGEILPYLERLIEIREKQFRDNPDKYYFALYVAYLVAGYACLNEEERSRTEDYGIRLYRIARSFHHRMNDLADADPESFIRLSDGSHDWYLKELFNEYPDAIPYLEGFYHDFHFLRWK